MASGSRLRPVSLLPSLITLGNLACGVAALLWILEAARTGDPGRLALAGWLILLAMIFDGMDGKIARLTRETSDLGAQLDSLSDGVTFGLVPAVLGRTLVLLEGPSIGIRMHPRLLFVAPILFAACAVLRLARFNLEHADEDPRRDRLHFAGIPTPAAAALPMALTLFYFAVGDPSFLLPLGAAGVEGVRSVILRSMPFLLIGLGALMVSRVPFPHLMGWLSRARRPFPLMAEVVITVGLLLVEPELALVLAALGFALLPLFPAALGLFRGRTARAESKPHD